MLYVGIALMIAGLFGGIKETIQQVNGRYDKTSLIAMFGGPPIPYWVSLVFCLVLIGIGGKVIGNILTNEHRRRR